MKDTLQHEGLVPSSLVFGKYPQVYTISYIHEKRTIIENPAAMLQSARTEMQNLIENIALLGK